MKLNSIKNINFQRMLTPLEKIENRVAINEAKKVLGIENMAIVTHSVCLPSDKSEDIGIGILSDNKGTNSYIDFLYNNGFDIMSVEPMGIITKEFYSPYDGTLFSKKPVIDFKELTTDKWSNILDLDTFEQAVKNKHYDVSVPKDETAEEFETVEFSKDMVIYDYVFETQEQLTKIAYENFLAKVANGDPKALEINALYEQFKAENDYFLKPDSIYSVLSKKYNTDSFEVWPNLLHRTLFNKNDNSYSNEEKEAEIEKITSENQEAIELYQFSQFVVYTQQKEYAKKISRLSKEKYEQDLSTIQGAYDNGEITQQKYNYLVEKISEAKRKNIGVKVLGDKQVGYSDIDIYSNSDIFTDKEFMGAPPNLKRGSVGQDWNFRFVPYNKMFNKDDSLASGGEFLKKAYVKAFEDNMAGIRIDHAIGLIDPWSYSKKQNKNINGNTFALFLSTQLKELTKFGVTSDKIIDLEDVVGAINGTNEKEYEILKKKGNINFIKAREVLESKKDFIASVQKVSVPTGSRHVFSYLLENDLKDLQQFGLNQKTIAGIIDPVRGIFFEDSEERKFLEQRGVKNFPEIQRIFLSKKDRIEQIYSNIIEKIVLASAIEVLKKRALENGVSYTEKELLEQARSLIICEDLGALTLPVKEILNKYNLIGMRDASRANPYDETNMYREINSSQKGNYWLITTHDSPSYIDIFKNYGEEVRKGHIDYLVSEMGLLPVETQCADNFFKILELKVERLFVSDKNPLTKNNILLNWTDILGILKRYNTPGVLDKRKNWNLRISESDDSFEKRYYDETLPSNRGINFPKILQHAIEICGLKDANKNLDSELEKLSKIVQE